MSTTLLCEKAYQFTKAKTYVFSDSVLCEGKMGDDPVATWRANLSGIRKTITSRISIESMVCRRSSSGNISQESQRWASSKRFKNWWQIYSVNRSTSKAGSCSCQCTTTLYGTQWETKNNVYTIHRQLRITLANSLAVIGLYWDLDQKKSGSEPTLTNQTDHGIEWLKKWIQISLDLVIRFFVLLVPLREENYEGKGRRKKSTHFNGRNETIELILSTVISANQVENPTVLAKAENSTNKQQWRNLRQEYERKIEQLSEDQKLSKLCSDAGLKLVERG